MAVSRRIRGDQVFGGREDPASMESDKLMKRLDQSQAAAERKLLTEKQPQAWYKEARAILRK